MPSKLASQTPPAPASAPVDAASAARLRQAIARLARQLRRPGTAELTTSQISALATIAQFMPLRLGDLATRESVSASTMSRLVDTLEERGMVRRARDPSDARSAQVSVTAEGAALLDDLRRSGTAMLYRATASLAGAERAAVLRALPALERLADAVEAAGSDPGARSRPGRR